VRHAKSNLPRRHGLPLVVALLCWSLLLGGAGTIAVRAAGGLTAVAGDAGSFIANVVPAPRSIDIPLSDPGGVVAAAPILDQAPDFVAAAALLIQGRVPSFAVETGRHVEITLNNGAAAAIPIDAKGHFALPVTLKDGPNAVVATLLSGRDVVATTSRTIVLDRVPPSLSIGRPRPGDVVDGSIVTVEGKAELYSAVTVNDRNVVVGADGSFTEAFTAPFGPVSITVVARDRAGNEARSLVTVVVRDRSAAGAVTLFVALDRPTVGPGGPVTATITLSDPSGPRAATAVTLSLGTRAIGTTKTDALGKATISFVAPQSESVTQVIVLGGGASGSATLTVTR
jgi:hypothetical protein